MNDKFLACESRREHKAWGASPRTMAYHDLEPAIAGDSRLNNKSFARSRGLAFENHASWGLRLRL
jgi:hypothetical protein